MHKFIVFFGLSLSVFCSVAQPFYKFQETSNSICALKINESSCSFDTVTKLNCSSFFLNDSYRGGTTTEGYFILPCGCGSEGGVLFMGLYQDTTFFLPILPGPDYAEWNEMEYNPNENCIYILSEYSSYTTNDSIAIIRYDMSNYHYSLITILPPEYFDGSDEILDLCTLDINSNVLYCKSELNSIISSIDLSDGSIDTIQMWQLNDSLLITQGLFFDKERHVLIGAGIDFSDVQNRLAIIEFDPQTRTKRLITQTTLKNTNLEEGYTYGYDDFNDSYLIYANQYSLDKGFYAVYNTNTGSLIDSCILDNKILRPTFFPLLNSNSINNESSENFIKLYPTIVVKNELHVSLSQNAHSIQFIIHDYLGRIIKKGEILTSRENDCIIAVENLPAGAYLLTVSANSILQTFKFFIPEK